MDELKIISELPTIMCVDDEDNILDALERLFEDDYNVIKAGSAEEGVKVYREFQDKIDIVLVDLKMPGQDGVGFIRLIKELNQEVICFILSGFNNIDSSVKEESENLVYGFLDKPWDDERLLNLVKGALKNKR